MADRAVGKGETGVPREVFELDKDERWQARLEEARARREIALREKAAGKPQPKRPKPWEVQGQDAPPPVEPIVEERGNDKFDFADRLEQLREAEEPKQPEPAKAVKSDEAKAIPPSIREPSEITRATPRPPAKPNRKFSRPPAGEAIERLRPPTAVSGRKASRPPADEASERLRPPPFAKPDGNEAPRRTLQTPSLVIPGAPDVEDIAARYANTLNPGETVVPEVAPVGPEVVDGVPEAAPSVTPEAEPDRSRRWLSFPALTTRPGVRPLGMAIGLLALAALPLTTVAPPLEKGPRMPVIAPFAAPPALGVTWSLYTRPERVAPFDWRRSPMPTALANPDFDPPIALQRGIAAPSEPVAQEETIALPRATDTPPADPVAVPGLDQPDAGIQPPSVETKPPLDEAASLSGARPAPPRARNMVPTAADTRSSVQIPSQPLRITILTPPGADMRVADDLAADIPTRGHDLVRIKSVDHAISQRNLRYFHDSDRSEAARLAREYDAELRDFTWFRPQPLPGTAELWLSGGSSGVERSVQGPTQGPEVLEEMPFVVIQPADPPPQARSDSLLNRVMQGVGNALGAGLGRPSPEN